MFVCLFVCLFVNVCICLFVCVFICLFFFFSFLSFLLSFFPSFLLSSFFFFFLLSFSFSCSFLIITCYYNKYRINVVEGKFCVRRWLFYKRFFFFVFCINKYPVLPLFLYYYPFFSFPFVYS